MSTPDKIRGGIEALEKVRARYIEVFRYDKSGPAVSSIDAEIAGLSALAEEAPDVQAKTACTDRSGSPEREGRQPEVALRGKEQGQSACGVPPLGADQRQECILALGHDGRHRFGLPPDPAPTPRDVSTKTVETPRRRKSWLAYALADRDSWKARATKAEAALNAPDYWLSRDQVYAQLAHARADERRKVAEAVGQAALEREGDCLREDVRDDLDVLLGVRAEARGIRSAEKVIRALASQPPAPVPTGLGTVRSDEESERGKPKRPEADAPPTQHPKSGEDQASLREPHGTACAEPSPALSRAELVDRAQDFMLRHEADYAGADESDELLADFAASLLAERGRAHLEHIADLEKERDRYHDTLLARHGGELARNSVCSCIGLQFDEDKPGAHAPWCLAQRIFARFAQEEQPGADATPTRNPASDVSDPSGLPRQAKPELPPAASAQGEWFAAADYIVRTTEHLDDPREAIASLLEFRFGRLAEERDDLRFTVERLGVKLARAASDAYADAARRLRAASRAEYKAKHSEAGMVLSEMATEIEKLTALAQRGGRKDEKPVDPTADEALARTSQAPASESSTRTTSACTSVAVGSERLTRDPPASPAPRATEMHALLMRAHELLDDAEDYCPSKLQAKVHALRGEIGELPAKYPAAPRASAWTRDELVEKAREFWSDYRGGLNMMEPPKKMREVLADFALSIGPPVREKENEREAGYASGVADAYYSTLGVSLDEARERILGLRAAARGEAAQKEEGK